MHLDVAQRGHLRASRHSELELQRLLQFGALGQQLVKRKQRLPTIALHAGLDLREEPAVDDDANHGCGNSVCQRAPWRSAITLKVRATMSASSSHECCST